MNISKQDLYNVLFRLYTVLQLSAEKVTPKEYTEE